MKYFFLLASFLFSINCFGAQYGLVCQEHPVNSVVFRSPTELQLSNTEISRRNSLEFDLSWSKAVCVKYETIGSNMKISAEIWEASPGSLSFDFPCESTAGVPARLVKSQSKVLAAGESFKFNPDDLSSSGEYIYAFHYLTPQEYRAFYYAGEGQEYSLLQRLCNEMRNQSSPR